MDAIKNSTGVASAGLPTKLNSRGDVDVPMEASAAPQLPVCLAPLTCVIPTFTVINYVPVCVCW